MWQEVLLGEGEERDEGSYCVFYGGLVKRRGKYGTIAEIHLLIESSDSLD